MRESIEISYSPNHLFHFTRSEDAVKSDVALEMMEKIYQSADELKEGTVLFELSKIGLRPNNERELLPYITIDLSNVFFNYWDNQAERVVYSIVFDFNLEGYKENRK